MKNEIKEMINSIGIEKTLKKFTTDEIIEFRDEFGWDEILKYKRIKPAIVIKYIEEILKCDEVLRLYLLNNRNINVDDLLKIRAAVKKINSNMNIDNFLIFNNNMSREKYNEIVFGMDDTKYLKLNRASNIYIYSVLQKYSFSEEVLEKICQKACESDNIYIVKIVFCSQKISEEFAKKYVKYADFNLDYILNNLPSAEFVKSEIFSNIEKLKLFLIKNEMKNDYRYALNKKYINSLFK